MSKRARVEEEIEGGVPEIVIFNEKDTLNKLEEATVALQSAEEKIQALEATVQKLQRENETLRAKLTKGLPLSPSIPTGTKNGNHFFFFFFL